MARILVVDDEKIPLNALVRRLSDDNPEWKILTASNEEEARAVVQEQLAAATPIDVILTDLVMDSNQSGMNVLLETKKLDPSLMAILFTAREQNLDRYKAFEYGAFDVVEKAIRGSEAAQEIQIKTRAALRNREAFRQLDFLRRYFDAELFDVILKDPSLLALRQRTVTICFWDIRGFSSLCEILKGHPMMIGEFLREHSQMVAQSIFSHGGLLDKFIGDGVMALFGVLREEDDEGRADALAAVRTAIDVRRGFRESVDRWKLKWSMRVGEKVDIGLRCGIHTGDVLVGNVGTPFRDQFTALGPDVNLASRLEGRAGDGQILLSQTTQVRVQGEFNLTKTEIDDIKNIRGKYEVYSL